MTKMLFAVFIVVPLIEIAIFILLGQTIGLIPTLAGVVITAILGSFLIRTQGLAKLREISRMARSGSLPAQQIVEGVMIAIAGALLLTPGYFSDSLGFLLLVPPVRVAIYAWLKSRVVLEAQSRFAGGPHRPAGPDVIDLDRGRWH